MRPTLLSGLGTWVACNQLRFFHFLLLENMMTISGLHHTCWKMWEQQAEISGLIIILCWLKPQKSDWWYTRPLKINCRTPAPPGMQAQATKSNFHGYKMQHCGGVHHLEEEEEKTWWIGEKNHQFNLRLPWIDWHRRRQLSAEEAENFITFQPGEWILSLLFLCLPTPDLFMWPANPNPFEIDSPFHLTSNGVARVTAICFDPALIYCISFTHCLHCPSIHASTNSTYLHAWAIHFTYSRMWTDPTPMSRVCLREHVNDL